MKTCKAKRYSDQMYCSVCQKQWDINDADRPMCDSKAAHRELVAQIAFAIAKLSCEQPNNPLIHLGLDWLDKNVRQ